MNMKKTYIIDTNVILHDFNAIYNFEENDVVIPIVVIEELDKFKKGNGIINFNARQIMRELDKISEQFDVFTAGISLGNDHGMLYVKTVHSFPKDFKRSFSEQEYADTKILSIALYLKDEIKNEEVILVTQDVNLRLKARAFGVKAQDYKTGKVIDVEKIYKEVNTFFNIDTSLIDRLYKDGSIPIGELGTSEEPVCNEYHILSDGNATALGYYDNVNKLVKLVRKQTTYHIKPRNSEQTFALDALLRKDIQLVTVTGRAGTGKTLLALAAALQQSHEFYQIMLARPIVALSDKDLGYLPGDATEKIKPYMQPLFDNLTVIKQNAGFTSKDSTKIDDMLKEEKLMITPLAYIRGRSLANTFFIIDEAQNLTPHEVKTIITRAGEGTKIVFTGDIDQIDSPYLDDRSNGLSYLTDKMKGQSIFAHVNLVKGERSQLAEIASKLL
ncbi:MAG: PhoH family protein [Bacteroidales bacterium]|nr:PhoH family protein [Bacteroidales bacterium]